jgi:ribonuclease P protein component
MISAKYRFHGYGALKFLFGHGKTYRFKSLSIRVAKNPRREHSRIAIVVSKKVLKAAPKRNQARRRMFEIIRTRWDTIAPGHDILVSIYDPRVLDMTHDDMVNELHTAFAAAHLLIDEVK